MRKILSTLFLVLFLCTMSSSAQTVRGKINFAIDEEIGQRDITVKYLGEARNFSRSDTAVTSSKYSRFGTLATPWLYTSNILNQGDGKGGYDSYNNLQALSIEHWYANSAAILNGKVWQVTTLPAGSYKLSVTNCTWDLAKDSLVFLCVNKGDTLENLNNLDKDITYKDFNQAPREITFTLTEDTKISWGLLANVPYELGGMSMRVMSFKLNKVVDGEDGDDVSSLLGVYDSIQRGDAPVVTTQYKRYGKPKYWTVENYSIDMGSNGMNEGIDKYIGVNELGMDQWYNNYVGADSKIYKKVTLPAGRYAFNAFLTSMYALDSKSTYQFASKVLPTTDNITTLGEDICSYACLSDYGKNNLCPVGVEFTLDKPGDVYLGWCGSFSEPTYEVRVSDVQLVRAVDESNGLPAYDDEALSSDSGKIEIPVNLWGDKGSYQTYTYSCQLAYPSQSNNLCYFNDWCDRAAVVGDVNFGNGKYDIAYLTCAYNGKNNGNGNTTLFPDPSIGIYLDSNSDWRGGAHDIDVEPLVLFKNLQIVSSGTDYTTYQVAIPDHEYLEGIHAVTVKQNGYGAYIYNIGFLSTTGVDGVKDNSDMGNNITVQSTSNEILLNGINKGIRVSIYDLSGSKVASFISNGVQNVVNASKGLYVIKAGTFIKKVVVR